MDVYATFPLWLCFLADPCLNVGRVVTGMISQAGFQLIRQLYLTNISLSLIRLHSLPIKALYDQICLYRAGAHRDDLNNVSMIT